MKFRNVYFFNGTAYAGKSTLVNAFLKQGLDEKSSFEETLQALSQAVR